MTPWLCTLRKGHAGKCLHDPAQPAGGECNAPLNAEPANIHVRGVVEGIGSEDGGCFIRLRLTQADAVKLMAAGAFNRIVQVRFEGE